MTLDMNTIITWIIVGGIAGLLAEWLIGGVRVGCIGAVVVGILGAFIGGWIFGKLGISVGAPGLVSSIITAFVGAAVLLLIIRLVRRV